MKIEDARLKFEPVIGLEVHAQLLTDTKIFCGCSTRFGAAPNSHTCPVCLGMPGVLPVLNKKVVDFLLKMAMATHCTINRESSFARKNYFYPDLPKGYQISQYAEPPAEHGWVDIEIEDSCSQIEDSCSQIEDSCSQIEDSCSQTEAGKKRIGITRIHMEEDAGKLIHDENSPLSYVDLNRTGVPLIEIVGEPDIRTAEEAAAYLKRLHEILVYLEICDGNMEEGSFRCDANISLRPVGQKEFGTRAELKNMNSFRNVQRALEYEIKRQQYILESGGVVVQETRLWDDAAGVTKSMRSKEEAHDYRYFPEPDLVRVFVDDQWLEEIRSAMPELPLEKRERFVSQYRISPYDAGVLTAGRALADYFEEVARLSGQPKAAANWVMGDILRFLNEDKKTVAECPVTPASLARMITLIQDGTISGKMAKDISEAMYKTGKTPEEIIEEKGLVQITDEDALAATLSEILAKNPDQVAQYRAGKDKLFGFFVGQAMKATGGKANPQMLNDLLKKMLANQACWPRDNSPRPCVAPVKTCVQLFVGLDSIEPIAKVSERHTVESETSCS